MHDAIDAGHGLFHGGHVADIGLENFLSRFGGAERRDIGKANERIAAGKSAAQSDTDLPGCAGDKNMLHASPFVVLLRNWQRPRDASILRQSPARYS